MAVATLQVSRLFPFLSTCVAALRRVVIVAMVDTRRDEENLFRFIKLVLAVTDHEAA